MGGQIPSNPFADHRYSQAQQAKQQTANNGQQQAQEPTDSNDHQPETQSTQSVPVQHPNPSTMSPTKAPTEQQTPWLRHIVVFLLGILLITASSYATKTSRTNSQWTPEMPSEVNNGKTGNEESGAPDEQAEQTEQTEEQAEGQIDGQNGEQGANGQVANEQNDERTAEASVATESESVVAGSNYQVTINGARLVRDGVEGDEGELFVVVDYTFTNVSHEQPISMSSAVRATACQEGVTCEHAVGGWSRGWDDSGYMTSAEMGASVNVSKGHALRSMTNDIVIEVKDYSESTEATLAQQTFSIAELHQ